MTTLGIGQLAKRAGVAIDTVRYYERNHLLAPAGRLASGYRRYGDSELKRLRFIRRAKALGFTLEDIRGLLGYELIVGPLRDDDWETVSSEDVSKALTKAAFDAQRFPGQDPLAQFVVTVNTISTSTNQPRTYGVAARFKF